MGLEYQLNASDNPEDFQCECGGALEERKAISDFKKTHNKSFNKSKDDFEVNKDNNLMKLTSIIIGGGITLVGIIGFLFTKSYSAVSLGTLGIMLIILGLTYKGYKIFIVPFTYFVVLFFVNLFQWVMLIYILFFSQINLTNGQSIILIAPLATTAVLIQIISKKQLLMKE